MRWLLLLVLPCSLAAQTPALDSAKVLRRELDSLEQKLRTIDSLKLNYVKAYRSAYHPGRWYAAAFVVGDGANAVLHVDPDHGGYVDSWKTPDKWMHFSVASFLTDQAMRLGVRPRNAVLVTCAGAWGWELSQGHVSWRDATASCSGAVVASGLTWLRRHIPKQVGGDAPD